MQHAARAPPDVRSSGISDHSRKDHAMSITGTAGTGARPRTSQFPWLPVTIGIGLVALILAGGLMVSLLTLQKLNAVTAIRQVATSAG